MHLCLLMAPTQSPGSEASGAARHWETLSVPSWARQVTALKGRLKESSTNKQHLSRNSGHGTEGVEVTCGLRPGMSGCTTSGSTLFQLCDSEITLPQLQFPDQ